MSKRLPEENLKNSPGSGGRPAVQLQARNWLLASVLDVLCLTDIAEHPTREGKLYCAAIMDAFSRRIIGWSIGIRQTAALVTNALRCG